MRDAHVFFHLFLDPLGAGLSVPPLKVIDYTLESVISVLRVAVSVGINVLQLFITGTVKQHLLEFFRQILIRSIQTRTIFLCKRIYHLPVEAGVLHSCKHVAQALLVDALIRVRYYQIRIDTLYETKPVAFRACSQRIVERKHPRFEFLYADSVLRACEARAEGLFLRPFTFVDDHLHQSVTMGDRKFTCFRQPALDAVLDFYPVYDYLYRMFECLPELYLFFSQDPDLTVDPHSRKSFLTDPFEYFLMLSFFLSYHRRHHCQFRSLAFQHQEFDYLIYSLTRDLSAAYRAVRYTYPCIHQPEIIVYFSYRSHRGTRILVCSFLVYRDRR